MAQVGSHATLVAEGHAIGIGVDKDLMQVSPHLRDPLLMLLAVVTLMTAGAETATAKSLYVIADHVGNTTDATQPVHAYDIGVDADAATGRDFGCPSGNG